MDDIVKQALAKWPNVPDCYGWLGLSSRGAWFMRDERTQAYGLFSSGTAQSRGSEVKHEKLIDFIQRNYEPDALGQWYFQNGPQRVYIELEITPLIWRLDIDGAVQDQTGKFAQVKDCLMDEYGRIYLEADRGLGLVHTSDMNRVAEAVELGLWVPKNVIAATLHQKYCYVMSPQSLLKK
jgi:hypothetical protein